MQVSLKVIGGNSDGKEIKISVPKFFIGRAEDCHLRPNSDMISRHHCVIIVEEGSVSIRDFGSRNGTYVNDEKLTEEVKLKTGDKLSVGQLNFEVQFVHSIGGKKRPKVTGIKDVAARTASTRRSEDVEVDGWLDEKQPPEQAAKKPADDDNLPVLKPAAKKDSAGKKDAVATSDTVAATNKDTKQTATPAAQTIFSELPRQAGKLPANTQQIRSKDSRDAATQMLKRLFDNR